MMKTHPRLLALAAAALLSACASGPIETPALTEARNSVRAAQADPAVQLHAADQLRKASDSLAWAERLSREREALQSIDSAAHIAATQARTAQALASAKNDEEAIKSAEAERERARADANASAAQRAQAQASQHAAAAQQAQNQAATAQVQAANAQADAARAMDQADQLRRELSELQTRQTERGTLVTLGDMLFETGRAELKPNAQQALQKLAAFLVQHPERRALIEGFTDNVGSQASNQQLSERRAGAVSQALQRLGVAAARIETRGYGESYPQASNASSTDRALNRRVEVYISDGNQPVPARG